MACDCENPCRECKGSGSECSMDPAECGHAVLPSSDNLLERAFMARIRADEYREAFVECATIAIGKAEASLGKAALDDCCEVEVKEIGVSVEYERPEAGE